MPNCSVHPVNVQSRERYWGLRSGGSPHPKMPLLCWGQDRTAEGPETRRQARGGEASVLPGKRPPDHSVTPWNRVC